MFARGLPSATAGRLTQGRRAAWHDPAPLRQKDLPAAPDVARLPKKRPQRDRDEQVPACCSPGSGLQPLVAHRGPPWPEHGSTAARHDRRTETTSTPLTRSRRAPPASPVMLWTTFASSTRETTPCPRLASPGRNASRPIPRPAGGDTRSNPRFFIILNAEGPAYKG